jgi:O-antigen/teichoic acid export membrane protein
MEENKNSYKRIIKSTSIIGGSQVIGILINIIRTKIMAVALGTTGVGLFGLYQSLLELIRNLSSFGINYSSVKDIAASRAVDDPLRLTRSIQIVKRWGVGTGILGFTIVLIFCIPLSLLTFGNKSHAAEIAFISISLLFTSIAQCQNAIMQGMQQISNMAKATIFTAFISTIITIPFFVIMGPSGIIITIILTSLITLVTNLYFSRNIKITKVKITNQESFASGLGMAKLGLFMVINSFLATATMYLTRRFLAAKSGIDSVGLFQAAWTISNIYVGIVLNAMLADFFPRLSSDTTDSIKMNRLTNEQGEITLILGAPLLILLLSISSIVMRLLYSLDFLPALPILRWQIIGSFFVLISWPIGVIFLAKGKGHYSVTLDVIGSIIYLLSSFIGFEKYGIKMFGIGYFIRAIISIPVSLIMAFKLTRFSFSKKMIELIFLYSSITLAYVIIWGFDAGYFSHIMLVLLTTFTVFLSIKKLNDIINLKKLLQDRLSR